VNSLEIDSIPNLFVHYRELFGTTPVVIHCRKILHYNRAAAAAQITVTYTRLTKRWEFLSAGNTFLAYKHRATDKSDSHCGVEFVSAPEYIEKKFARRIASGKPHIQP
jgi:hypothetical protein